MTRTINREDYVVELVSDIEYLLDLGLGIEEILEGIDDRNCDPYHRYKNSEIIEAFKRCGYEVVYK